MANEQSDKYGSRQLTELENLRAERDAYKQQAEFSAGEIKRLQLNAGIFEDVKAARDNAERDANALRAQLSMRTSQHSECCTINGVKCERGLNKKRCQNCTGD